MAAKSRCQTAGAGLADFRYRLNGATQMPYSEHELSMDQRASFGHIGTKQIFSATLIRACR
jgi:hypothetical protein